LSLPSWVYKSVFCALRDKLKLEQLLANFIDSVNHYAHKAQGVRLFSHFLAEKWPIDALFYFLVLRGLLEQTAGERILDRTHGGQGLQGVLGYRLRSNPHEKDLSEEEVLAFL
jgi:hypothetical protein